MNIEDVSNTELRNRLDDNAGHWFMVGIFKHNYAGQVDFGYVTDDAEMYAWFGGDDEEFVELDNIKLVGSITWFEYFSRDDDWGTEPAAFLTKQHAAQAYAELHEVTAEDAVAFVEVSNDIDYVLSEVKSELSYAGA